MAFFGLTALAGMATDGPFRANTRSVLNIRTKEDWIVRARARARGQAHRVCRTRSRAHAAREHGCATICRPQEIFHLFQLYDEDGNGMFDTKELKNLLTTFCNRDPPDHEVELLAKRLDQNRNGLITWDEFVEGLRTASGEASTVPRHAMPARAVGQHGLSLTARPSARACRHTQLTRVARSSCR